MAFYDSLPSSGLNLNERFKQLNPAEVKKLAGAKLSDIVLQEIARSRMRVDELQKRYPSAGTKELAQHLIDGKKALAGMAGGVSGVFGLISVPADLLFMSWLQIILLVDVATRLQGEPQERARPGRAVGFVRLRQRAGAAATLQPQGARGAGGEADGQGRPAHPGPRHAAGGRAHHRLPQQPAHPGGGRAGRALLRGLRQGPRQGPGAREKKTG